jgi:hypothetical protein
MARRLRVVLLAAPAVAWGFDFNGVAIGAREADVKKAFPSAHCQPLEWQSRAAERRCDDARVAFAGVPGRITFYLKGDAIQAFDFRFASSERERVVAQLKARWGAPANEGTESFVRHEGEERRTYKVRWSRGKDQAVLAAPINGRRATLAASRGNFDEEIYRVR